MFRSLSIVCLQAVRAQAVTCWNLHSYFLFIVLLSFYRAKKVRVDFPLSVFLWIKRKADRQRRKTTSQVGIKTAEQEFNVQNTLYAYHHLSA